MNEQYTEAILAVVCPKCHAVGKCLDPVRDGNKFIEEPHKERVEASKRLK